MNLSKKIIFILLIVVLVSGCTSDYEECLDYCVRVICLYNDFVPVEGRNIDTLKCGDSELTIREYCDGECEGESD